MRKKVYIDTLGFFTLTDKEYIASGGQASVYRVANMAIKIYHNEKDMLPTGKIQELSLIPSKNVYKPLNLVYNETKSKLVGYSMLFSPDSNPICKMFTKSFKNQNNIKPNDIVDLVKLIQKTISEIHKSNTLIVDLNEMNLILDSTNKYPIFIDVDSYQTPSYKATAIMDSIRDRTVKNNQWTELSDWYSFAILAFQLYIGIHPYKGKHPSYKSNEWLKRMDDNVSVFDKSVSMPSVCEPFSVIPDKHLDWFKNIFQKGLRDYPPLLDNLVFNIASVAKQIQVLQTNASFIISKHYEVDRTIHDFCTIFGVNYSICTEGNTQYLYKQSGFMKELPFGNNSLLYTVNHQPLLVNHKNSNLKITDLSGNLVLDLKASHFYKDKNKIFSLNDNLLTESVFDNINNKIIPKIKTYSVSYASKVYEGCLIQNLLEKYHLTFIDDSYFINKYIPELEGYRILECKRQKNFVVIICEKGGIYDRFVLHFDMSNKYNVKYDLRKTENVNYDVINFVVLDNDVAILQITDDSIELFRDNYKIKVLDNIPFNYATYLFNNNNDVFYIDKNQVINIKIK